MKNEKWGIPYRSYVPTETLLRLHLPLSDKVQTSSRCKTPMKEFNYNPEASPEHSIGRCDGRCVLQIYIGGERRRRSRKYPSLEKVLRLHTTIVKTTFRSTYQRAGT